MVSSVAATENQFAEELNRFIESVDDQEVLDLRTLAFATFSLRGVPPVKSEDWKYTNVAPIAKESWIVKTLGKVSQLDADFRALIEKFNYERNGFAALNQAFADIVCIRIPKETSIER